MILTIDFETRSPADLKKVGQWKYAEHPGTQVSCLGVKVDAQPGRIWFPGWVRTMHPSLPIEITNEEVRELLAQALMIFAHNAEFESALWQKVEAELGSLPFEKLRCTAAMAAYHALPRKLESVGAALNLPIQKDKEGHALMLKMCKPQVNNKTGETYWIEDLESFRRQGEYCRTDVDTEYLVADRLKPLPDGELAVWREDQIINRRGVLLDVQFTNEAVRVSDEQQTAFKAEMKTLTGTSPNQVAKIREWVAERGFPLHELTKASVVEALSGDLPDVVRRVLEIRQGAARTSAQKYKAALDTVQQDGRARAMFLYHAATTGRWSGKKIQLHNLPSRGIIKDTELAIEMIRNGASAEEIEFFWGDTMHVLASCTRGTIIAPPGKDLIVADFSAIEARVLAWLVGEEHVLEAYRRKADLYVLAAAAIFHKRPEDVTRFERQIGKVTILACGYQGGKHAFIMMAKNYGIEELPEEDAAEIVRAWREAHPQTVSFWRDCQDAAVRAINNPGEIVACRRVLWSFRGSYLMCRLPSKRILHYPFPRMDTKPAPWDAEQMIPVIRFWGMDINSHWAELETYGGRLTENIVQAIARDLLAEALVRLENTGKYAPVAHVHDECVAEVAQGAGDMKEFCGIMNALPDWATGLPMESDGYIGKRYRK